jgi:hypothetical protein
MTFLHLSRLRFAPSFTRHARLLTGLALVASACACTSPVGGPAATHETTEITLQSSEDITPPANAKVHITLWGFDRGVADAPSTRLSTFEGPITEVPTKVEMQIPIERDRHVSPSSGDPANLCYYVTLAVDVDGDGQICAGDLRVEEAHVRHAETCSIDAMEKTFTLRTVQKDEKCFPLADE